MKKVILGLVLSLSLHAQALTAYERDHLTIDTIKVEAIPDQSPLQAPCVVTKADAAGDIKGVGVILDAIINIGQRIWVIAEKNKPVYENQIKSASAMPEGITDWQQMSGWQDPQSYSYRIVYTNLYGMNVIDFTYRIIFTAGGSFNGRGQFITGATIVPSALDVAWGYTFKSTVEIPTITNKGSVENPVAGIQMNLSWSVDTILKHSESRTSYFIDGFGQFREMN